MLKLLKITLLFITLLLTSCIDGKEEITIHKDGSGSVKINYTIPKQALAEKDANTLQEFLLEIQKRNPSVQLKTFEIKTRPRALFGPTMQTLNIQLDFDSTYKLSEIYEAELARLQSQDSSTKPDPKLTSLVAKSKAILGTIDIQLNGLTLDFNRTIDLEPLFEGRLKNGNIFGNSKFHYIINLPIPAGENNATTTTNEGKTLQWTIGLKESFGKPIRMKSKIPAPIWFKITIILVPLTIITIIILSIRAITRKRRKKHPKPTYEPAGI